MKKELLDKVHDTVARIKKARSDGYEVCLGIVYNRDSFYNPCECSKKICDVQNYPMI